jgi:hypothetical protein
VKEEKKQMSEEEYKIMMEKRKIGRKRVRSEISGGV